MDQTIIFDKIYEERLQDYLDVFTGHDLISSNEITSAWALYLESIVDPFGWQAIWKIPFYLCKEFRITYPTLALVYVDSVHFETLTATVKILMVENTELPVENYEIDLIHLWPTEVQDETLCLNLTELSNSLDKLRFFYKHLWRPWDCEENFQRDWLKNQLETRLRLYYDLKNGIIPKNMAHYYRSQFIEAKEKYLKLQQLQNELEENEDSDLNMSIEDSEEKQKFDLLYALHADLTKLKSKLALFENPILRPKRLQLDKIHNEKCYEKPNMWLVFDSDKQWDEYMNFMENVKHYCADIDLSCNTATSLQQAFDELAPNDIIYIGSGTHIVTGAGNFAAGSGTIINVDYPKEAFIESRNEHSLFEIANSSTIVLENLVLSLNEVRYGIKVKPGSQLQLSNCILTGNSSNSEVNIEKSSIQQGISIDASRVLFKNCKIENIATGISISGEEASLTMENCTISGCDTAIRVHNIIKMKLDKCKIRNCENCAINLEVEEGEKKNGGINILEMMPNIKIIKTQIDTSCSAPDVILTSKIKFKPIRDVLSNPEFNTSLNRNFNY